MLIERRYLQITEKFLVLNFYEMGNTVFFEPKNLMKDEIYWLRKSPCFELFDEGKYDFFFIEKSDEKIIFTSFF